MEAKTAIGKSAEFINVEHKNPFLKRFKVFLPSSVKLDNILVDYPFRPSYHRKNPIAQRDRLAYILGQIYSSLVNTTGDIFPENGYTPICSINLQRITKNYKEYVNYALDIGLIKCNRDYYFDHERQDAETRCMKYKFSDQYFNEKTRWKPYYIYDKKVIQLSDRSNWGIPNDFGSYPLLEGRFHDLSIDMDMARDTLIQLYNDDQDTIDLQLDLARRVGNKDLWSFIVGRTGRLYTPFSNINKTLRKHMTLGGEPMYEIDIVNSIPFQSLVLFDNEKLTKNTFVNDLINRINPLNRPERITDADIRIKEDYGGLGWGKHSYLGVGENIHVHLGKNGVIASSENIQQYKSMVLDGSLYQHMADVWNMALGQKDAYNRKTAKERLLAIMNSPSTFQCLERETFKGLFPDVIDIIDLLNWGYFKTNKGKGKARKRKGDIDCPFAMFTQGLESHLVLDLVSNDIINRIPEIKLITLHDAIYTTRKYVLNIVKAFEEHALELTGNMPRLCVSEVSSGRVLEDDEIRGSKLLKEWYLPF